VAGGVSRCRCDAAVGRLLRLSWWELLGLGLRTVRVNKLRVRVAIAIGISYISKIIFRIHFSSIIILTLLKNIVKYYLLKYSYSY